VSEVTQNPGWEHTSCTQHATITVRAACLSTFRPSAKSARIAVALMVIGLGFAACGGGGASSATQIWWNITGKPQLNRVAAEAESLPNISNLTPASEIQPVCDAMGTDSQRASSNPPPAGSLKSIWVQRLNDVSTWAGDCSASSEAGQGGTAGIAALGDLVHILKDVVVIQNAAKAQGLN
jgi:hypothetical protein